MTGTEKQIAWATEIIDLIKTIFDEFERANKNYDNLQQIHEIAETIIKNMNDSYAGNIIEDFRNIVFYKNKINDSYREFCDKLFLASKFNKRDYRKNSYK